MDYKLIEKVEASETAIRVNLQGYDQAVTLTPQQAHALGELLYQYKEETATAASAGDGDRPYWFWGVELTDELVEIGEPVFEE